MLSRREIEAALRRWHQVWADHDLDKDGKIIRKLTYTKATLEIDGKRVRLQPEDLK
jgi:hypothetical protein